MQKKKAEDMRGQLKNIISFTRAFHLLGKNFLEQRQTFVRKDRKQYMTNKKDKKKS